jgi:hypothetical protein
LAKGKMRAMGGFSSFCFRTKRTKNAEQVLLKT